VPGDKQWHGAPTLLWPRQGETEVKKHDHIYKVIEIVGSSETSIEDAIQRAVARASQTLKHLRWFEVIQTRGHIENGKVHHYQVTLKIGFTLDES
jgi:flavin-binding protein dodecin